MRLTETEKKVAELHGRGLRPREIAETLGISINTVYKALSKARRAMGEDAGGRLEVASGAYSYTLSVTVIPAAQGQPAASSLEGQLRRLEELMARLEALLTRLPPSYAPSAGEAGPRDNGHMPEHLKKNIWVSLIRNKA